jgi:hypothetical protein
VAKAHPGGGPVAPGEAGKGGRSDLWEEDLRRLEEALARSEELAQRLHRWGPPEEGQVPGGGGLVAAFLGTAVVAAGLGLFVGLSLPTAALVPHRLGWVVGWAVALAAAVRMAWEVRRTLRGGGTGVAFWGHLALDLALWASLLLWLWRVPP